MGPTVALGIQPSSREQIPQEIWRTVERVPLKHRFEPLELGGLLPPWTTPYFFAALIPQSRLHSHQTDPA